MTAVEVKMGDKLYIVTRRDLSPGQQAVQGLHAFREFINDWPERDDRWYRSSNHIAFLSVADENALRQLCMKASQFGAAFSVFHEPDLNDSLTACVIEAGSLGTRVCKGLSLALR